MSELKETIQNIHDYNKGVKDFKENAIKDINRIIKMRDCNKDFPAPNIVTAIAVLEAVESKLIKENPCE